MSDIKKACLKVELLALALQKSLTGKPVRLLKPIGSPNNRMNPLIKAGRTGVISTVRFDNNGTVRLYAKFRGEIGERPVKPEEIAVDGE